MHKIVRLLVATTLLAIASQANAQIRVFVNSQGQAATEVASLAKRELRTFRDVVIVDQKEDPDYGFYLVSIETKTESGARTGYALSTTGVTFYPPSLLAPELRASHKDGVMSLDNMDLYLTSLDGLQRTVQKAVAKFDSDQLEPHRRMNRLSKESSGKPRK